MKRDIREEILNTKPKRMGFGTQRVPSDCAAGRCGHKSLPTRTVLFSKETTLQVMDEYAERILQYMHDNELSISMSRDWDIKRFLGEIKTEWANEKDK